MKVEFKIERGYPYLVIKYENNEWEKIENILKSLNLEKSVTKMGFGKGLMLEYYREKDTELLNYLKNYIRSKLNYVIDDINRSLYDDGYFNIAIFRVIPDKSNEVRILLDKYLTISELRHIFENIKIVYELLMNIALKATAEIKLEE
jgi:hypothetical protein